MISKAFDAIKKYDVIIIHRHSNPDGDAMGSQIGLKRVLQVNFPDKKIYAVGDDARRFSFMDGSEMDVVDDAAYKGALAIVLDTSAKSLISDERYALAKTVLRIDGDGSIIYILQVMCMCKLMLKCTKICIPIEFKHLFRNYYIVSIF